MITTTPNTGTWWAKSISDPRWDRTKPTTIEELTDWLNECVSQYGEHPNDLEWGFKKD